MADHDLVLLVEGEEHRGLMTTTVDLSLEQIAHPFSITAAERVDRKDPSRLWWLEAQDFVEIMIDGEILVDGFVDRANVTRAPRELSFKANGRARPGDLVDCSIVGSTPRWRNAKPTDILSDICEPFGLTVEIDDNAASKNEVLETFKRKRDEKAFQVIRRLCELRGLWPSYDSGGVLRLADPAMGRPVANLEVGISVQSIEWTTDYKDRFSQYHFCGGTRATDDVFGKDAQQLRSDAFDPGVARYRPLRVQKNGNRGVRDMGVRALRERNQRAGRSETYTARVVGWTNPEGKLWRPGQAVTLTDRILGLDNVRLVIGGARYTHSRSSEGFVTDLTLQRIETYNSETEYPGRAPRETWDT